MTQQVIHLRSCLRQDQLIQGMNLSRARTFSLGGDKTGLSTSPALSGDGEEYYKIWLTTRLRNGQEVTTYHSDRCERALSEISPDSLEALTPCQSCITFEENHHVLNNEPLFKTPMGKRYHVRHCHHARHVASPMIPCNQCFSWSEFREGTRYLNDHS